MKILLFDTVQRAQLFPLTMTRAVADLRMGILTIKERWERLTGEDVYILTEEYLQPLYPPVPDGEYLLVDARVQVGVSFYNSIKEMQNGTAIADETGIVAGKARILSGTRMSDLNSVFQGVSTVSSVGRIVYPYHLFQNNAAMITYDYALLTKKRISQDTNDTIHVKKVSNVFIEEGAVLDFSTLNASAGPIYIGKNATIMEGCLIRGPFALCEGAVLKMDTKIYGATTVGPYSTAGGEIKNSILMGYSNKAHDGYLGDSVVGEWCNLGAGTSNSNLKNHAGEVKVFDYYTGDFISAGNKCGMIMGDHSKSAINSSINTGTVVGICANITPGELTPAHIPSFTWLMGTGEKYKFEKAAIHINNWKKMKNKSLDEIESKVLKHIFETYQ